MLYSLCQLLIKVRNKIKHRQKVQDREISDTLGCLRHPRVSEISLSCTFAGARFYISSDTWNSLIVTSMIYFEADENGNYIWKDCKKKKSHVFGTQISFVTLWEIATKLKQNKESTPLWVNWTYFFFQNMILIWYMPISYPFILTSQYNLPSYWIIYVLHSLLTTWMTFSK